MNRDSKAPVGSDHPTTPGGGGGADEEDKKKDKDAQSPGGVASAAVAQVRDLRRWTEEGKKGGGARERIHSSSSLHGS